MSGVWCWSLSTGLKPQKRNPLMHLIKADSDFSKDPSRDLQTARQDVGVITGCHALFFSAFCCCACACAVVSNSLSVTGSRPTWFRRTPSPVFAEISIITATLQDTLHWLSVPQRILFKVALMAFDCVRGQGPGYFDDVREPVRSVGARAPLRSADHDDMFITHSCTVLFG